MILDLACEKVSIERCVEKVCMDSKIRMKKCHLPDITYVPVTLCYDPHLRFPAYFYFYCHDIPPLVICVTICTVLHGTGCPSVPHT